MNLLFYKENYMLKKILAKILILPLSTLTHCRLEIAVSHVINLANN